MKELEARDPRSPRAEGLELAELAKRHEKITKLFLVLGMDGTKERIQGWVEATEKIPLPELLMGCRDLVHDWRREAGFPFPGDLIRYCKPYVARRRAIEADAERRAENTPALPAGGFVPTDPVVDSVVAGLSMSGGLK